MEEKSYYKFRRKTIRLQNWNYAWDASYFITICTKNRQPYFGEIRNGEMHISKIGQVALDEWHKTEKIRSDMNLILDEFIIMPDHIHGIIHIGENDYNNSTTTMHGGSTEFSEKMLCHPTNQFGPQRKNLASIIRGYKSSITTFARKNNIEFNWQSKFYEHIIRNQEALERIRNYIIKNPSNWNKD